jgi:hypothetical protein
MPTKNTLILNHNLNGDFDTVYTSLLDFEKFGQLHPYMKEVKVIKRHSECIEYHITEEIYFFGFIKNHPKYTAKVYELEKGKHLRYTSPVKPFIFLTLDIHLSEKNGRIDVRENIELECMRFIGLIFLNILKKAHLKFFENLRTHMRQDVSVES